MERGIKMKKYDPMADFLKPGFGNIIDLRIGKFVPGQIRGIHPTKGVIIDIGILWIDPETDFRRRIRLPVDTNLKLKLGQRVILCITKLDSSTGVVDANIMSVDGSTTPP